MAIIAVDAKEFHREGLSGSFDACIRVSVLVESDDRFERRMEEAWNSARENQGIPQSDVALKSAHVKELIGPSDAHEFTGHVVREMSSYVVELRFHYTYLNTRRIAQVQVYGRDRGPNARWSVADFLERLKPSYTHCCAWRHLKELSNEDVAQVKFLVDSFEGRITRAWEELSSLPPERLELWFSGDLCNAHILLADTLVSYLDSKMNISAARLNPRDIRRVFVDELFPVIPSFLGQRYLPNITPVTRRMCDIPRFLRHPILFVAGPKTPSVVREQGVSMRDVLERHPVMIGIVRYAKKIGGCVKFFHAGGDHRLFRAGDAIVYVGKEGLEVAQKYSELYDIKMIDAFSLLRGRQ